MTIENNLYGPNWTKCARCGTTQPLADLEHRGPCDSSEHFDKAWCCKRIERCNTWRAQNESERAAFEQAHPLLVVRKQPTEAEQDAAHAAFLDSVAKDCHCRTGVVCGGVQQGAGKPSGTALGGGHDSCRRA